MNYHRWRISLRGEGEAGPAVVVECRSVSDESVTLSLSLTKGFMKTLEDFLSAKLGFLASPQRNEAISLLLEWGSSGSPQGTPLTNAEKFAIVGMHSSLHFKLYECYNDNQSVAMGLRAHCELNRRLKKRLVEVMGPAAVPRDEWDSWDEAVFERFQRKYLFLR